MYSRTTASVFATSALLSFSVLFAAPPASACTGAQFVAKRIQLHCNTKLSYADVEANPFDNVGKVLELRGTVGGSVTSEGRLSVMLNMEGGKAVMLDIPSEEAAEVRDLSTPQLRALVQIKENKTGNVVSLQTLAVAYETTVAAEDKLIQARQEAERKKADWKRHEQERWKASMDRAMHSRSVAPAPSRGSFQRAPMSISGIPPASPNLSPRALPLYPAYFHFIAQRNTKLSAAQAAQIAFHLLDFADRFNVDPRLVVAMIIAESEFDPRSTSRTGAKGLGQLMPETARDLGVNNPYDIVQNLGGSINYLRSRLDMFAGPGHADGSYSFDQVALAMAAYNAGENAVKRYRGVPPYRETQAYVKRVTSLYRQLCQ